MGQRRAVAPEHVIADVVAESQCVARHVDAVAAAVAVEVAVAADAAVSDDKFQGIGVCFDFLSNFVALFRKK